MKKKVFLRVRQKGIMFQLGKNKFRSPVDIDVTQYKIDPIIYQMRMNGIDDYEIFTKKVGNIVKPDSKLIILDSKTDDIDRLNSKVENLENILLNLLNQNEERNREQNNKDDNLLSKIEEDSSKLKLNKDVKLEIKRGNKESKKKDNVIIKKNKKKKIILVNKKIEILNDIKIKHVDNKIKKKINVPKILNDDILLKNKKVIIEELEDIIYDVDIKLEELDDEKAFEPKPFNEIMTEKKPFELSSDVEMLKKFKRK